MVVVTEMEQERPIWLTMGGVTNCCHIVEDNRLIQWIIVYVLCR